MEMRVDGEKRFAEGHRSKQGSLLNFFAERKSIYGHEASNEFERDTYSTTVRILQWG